MFLSYYEKFILNSPHQLMKNCDYRYFLFDWDGCLVDSLKIWYEAMKNGLLYFDIETSEMDIKKGFQSWDIFPELGVTDMSMFTKKVYEHISNSLININFNDGVRLLLKQIKKNNLKSAIVTSTERTKVIPVLERLQAMSFFECIIGRDDVTNLKPDPEPVEKALDIIDGDRTKSVMIGDSIADIEAGKKAGIATVWFSSPYNQQYHLIPGSSAFQPDFTISHMSDLEILL